MKKFALAFIEARSPLYDRRFRESIGRQYGEINPPPNPLLEPAWLGHQVRLPAQLPTCVAYQRRPNLRAALPHPLFDTDWYLNNHPEAKNHKWGALGHYLEVGEQLGHTPSPHWSVDDEPLTHALKTANEFLANPSQSKAPAWADAQPVTLLLWDDPSDALAQARALVEADWPLDLAVALIGQRTIGPQVKAQGKAHSRSSNSNAADRVLFTSAIALLNTRKTHWFTRASDAISAVSNTSTPRWVVTLIGAPRSTTLTHATELIAQTPAPNEDFLVNYTEPKTGQRETENLGEVLLYSSSLLPAGQKSLSASTDHPVVTATELINAIVARADRRGTAALVPGLELGDEYALAPMPVIKRVSQNPDRLRWCIKTPVTSANTKSNWGDTWFAQDLAAALRDLDQSVVIDSQNSLTRATADLTDVNLILQGRWQPGIFEAGLNLCWVISNPELADPAELRQFDAVFIASQSFTKAIRSSGLPAETLLQCTNPAKFRPVDEGELQNRIERHTLNRLSESALFVGGARLGSRPIVDDALRAGAQLMVYGHGWADTLSPQQLIQTHLPNEELPYFYQAAGIVLADHEESMRVNGFMSNRLFDAAAAGARVLCDAVVGDQYQIEDIFGASVKAYTSLAELRGLLIDPQSAWPPNQLRRENAVLIGEQNSFKARAKVLLERALAVRAN